MPAYIPNIIEHTTFTSTYPACIYTILPAAAVKPIIKELVAVAAFIGISEIKFIPGIIIADGVRSGRKAVSAHGGLGGIGDKSI